jgi:CRISPR-associated endonuclease/helicase Cas3
VDDGDVLVLKPGGDDVLSTVTARLPEYESEPTQYDKSTAEIEELLQTKIHRRIDRIQSYDEFKVSTELLHRFFRIIRIVNAVVPSRITTSEHEIKIDTPTNGIPTIEVHRRQI